ncbi:hypothetical protein BI081_gp146 [Mycobacterium phage Tonenili]|uniref:Uncharacterized protein n=1 Tax=Mycobacterium phage Tonenili TaxID=1891703 RepID=A0A1C9EHI5_9CAUD|nr:hypothetical protein BI081_gp146 [Mycobacterium phage Tonenili]AON96961.1 hypothetical protein SEA_TONENILI_241 [Mycobacterium phage Tonenili]
MTAPPNARRVRGVSRQQVEADVSREVAVIRNEYEPQLNNNRCRICQHPDSRTRVNTLLGYGLRDFEILECISDINEKRSKNNKITRDSLRNHKQRHFNVQDSTRAAYRRILERRKAQMVEEVGEASANLLTGMGFLEVIAYKGFQNAIDDTTVVPYMDGLQAQLKLESMVKEGQVEAQIANMRREVGLLQQAVRDVVPEEYMSAILERIDELTGEVHNRRDEDDDRPTVVDAEIVTDNADDFFDQDDDDDVAAPTFTADEGDSIEG